mmetsp:Transcript_16116/g.25730  ORF Transcript_16116/g.25730 Transcript_16116/m.25730 type:complete len:83 (-) Transcript_16116:934-1182(-)
MRDGMSSLHSSFRAAQTPQYVAQHQHTRVVCTSQQRAGTHTSHVFCVRASTLQFSVLTSPAADGWGWMGRAMRANSRRSKLL